MKTKFFGAALDPADSPEKVSIKIGYLNALRDGKTPEPNFLDPYDAVAQHLPDMFQNPDYIQCGKFSVESWLTSKPLLEDFPLITPENYRVFLDTNGCEEYARALQKFVEEHVLPDTPAMIGVDHSLTGGVLRALSHVHGAENISVVVIDAHFDAISQKARVGLAEYVKEIGMRYPLGYIPSAVDASTPEMYNCGTYLRHTIEQKVVLPKNLIVIGVADYPDEKLKSIDDNRVKKYVDSYLQYEKDGVTLIPSSKIDKNFPSLLAQSLKNVSTPWVYASLDVDVGSYSALYAARFLDAIGIGEEEIYEIARQISKRINSGAFQLAGFDVMEVDVHLAGAKFSDGKEDRTSLICGNFIKHLLGLKIL